MATNHRKVITPDAFAVAPDLLGIALARPSRRLLAIVIDGILLAILAKLGGKMLFTGATALLLWKASKPLTASSQHFARVALRAASVIMIPIFLVVAYKWAGDQTRKVASSGDTAETQGADSADERGASGAAADTGSASNNGNVTINMDDLDLGALGLSLRDARMLPFIAQVGEAQDSATAAVMTDSLARWVASRPDSTRAPLAAAIVASLETSPGSAAARASLAPYLTSEPAATDTAALLAAAQRRATELSQQVARLERRNRDLREQIEDPENPFTFTRLLRRAQDVFGFGLGYSALYFTGFMMLFAGQTPGKKLLGIRVIRLDGRPISAWIAFERFGGYAASTATGLLGFAQMMWDRNRQALHDKVTETVVIRERRGVPVRLQDPLTKPGLTAPVTSPAAGRPRVPRS